MKKLTSLLFTFSLLLFTSAVQAEGLPAGYKAVEWIESTEDGGQFIDTDYVANGNTKVEFSVLAKPVAGCVMFGSRVEGDWTYHAFTLQMYEYTHGTGKVQTVRFAYNGAYRADEFEPFPYNERVTVTCDGKRIAWEREKETSKFEKEFNAASLNSSPSTLYIFADNTVKEEGGTRCENGYNRCAMRLYSFKITEGDVVKRNFTPCVRTSDGAIGLYDLAATDSSKAFYPNKGTGVFDIPAEPTETEGSKDNPWKIGSPDEEDVLAWIDRTTLIIEGTGKMRDFWRLDDIPWWYVHGQLTAVELRKGVTNIGAYAFCNCSVLSSVTIPEGVTSIGSSAFSGCALTSVEIPEGVTSIGEDMFNGCQQLESVTLPKGVTSIGAYAFGYCAGLKSVEIPEGVTNIGDNAFCNCGQLTGVTIPSTVERIGYCAFVNCDQLASVTVQATKPPECGENAFENCNPGGDFVILVPKGCATKYRDAWSEYADKIPAEDEEWFPVVFDFQEHGEPVQIEVKAMCTMEKPNDPEADGYLFGGWFKEWYCENEWDFATDIVTESITLYAKWTEVPPGSEGNPWKIGSPNEEDVTAYVKDGTLFIAGTGEMCNFEGSSDTPWTEVAGKLTAVEIGEGVTSIGDSAFEYCDALESVTIPSTVTSIGDYAFYSCDALTSVTVLATIPPKDGRNMFKDCHDDLLIFVPRARIGDYQAEWSAYEKIIKPSTVELALTAGEGYGYVVSNLTKSVEIVAEDGRYELPVGASVGIYAVAKDGYVISAVDPLVIDEVAEDLSVDPAELPTPTAYAPGSVGNPWQIGSPNAADVLAWTNGTGKLIVEGTGEIRDNGGRQSSPWVGSADAKDQFTVAEIGEGVTSIGYCAFSYCEGLTSVTIPSTVDSIGELAFWHCSALTSVTVLAEEPPTGGKDMFKDCHDGLLIYVPANRVEDYKWEDGWSAYANNIKPVGYVPPVEIALTAGEGYGYVVSNLTDNAAIAPDEDGKYALPVGASVGIYAVAKDGYVISAVDPLVIGEVAEGFSVDQIELPTPTAAKIASDSDFDFDDGTITKYKGSGGNVAIPSTINGEAVTGIGEKAFYGIAGLTGVTIPAGVTDIGNEAFYGCRNLTGVTIPGSVTNIGQSAFCSCRNLAGVTIPEGVTGLGNEAFHGCGTLTGVTIPSTMASIGYDAFCGCLSLTNVTVRAAVPPTGGERMFESCHADLVIVVPAGCGDTYRNKQYWEEYKDRIEETAVPVVEIELPAGEGYRYVVSNLTDNAEIEAGEDGTYALPIGARVGIYAVAKDGYLISAVDPLVIDEVAEGFSVGSAELPLPTAAKIASDSDFDFDDGTITKYKGSGGNVAIPSTINGEAVTSIGINAFAYRSNLTSVMIPEGVTSIGNSAFSSCENLTSVTIPSSVTDIGYCTFDMSCSISELHIDSVESWCRLVIAREESNPFGYSSAETKTLYVGGQKTTKLVIPDGITAISPYAFDNWDMIESVSIPSTVTSIGDSAFSCCGNLASVTIPEGVKSIGMCAFFLCDGLKKVTIPESVTSIDANAFYGCGNLASVTVQRADPPTCGAGMFSSRHDGLLIYVPANSVGDYRGADGWSAYKDIIVPIGYDPSRVVEIELPAGEGYGYVVSNLTVNAAIAPDADGRYALPVGASVGIYAVAKDGYAISEVDPLVIGEVDENTKVEDKDLPTPTVHALEGTKGNPWQVGTPNEADVVAYVKNGTLFIEGAGAMRDFEWAMDAPWEDIHVQLTAVEIGDGVTRIGDWAFFGCAKLTSVKIPEGVTGIGDNAFASCKKLAGVEIPSTVESIGEAAFSDCAALTSVTVQRANPPTGEERMFSGGVDFEILVPLGCVVAYRKADGWREYADKIKPIGYDPSRVVRIALPTGEGYGYVVSNLTDNAAIAPGKDGKYALPVGATVGIYAVAKDGYLISAVDPLVIGEVAEDLSADQIELPTPTAAKIASESDFKFLNGAIRGYTGSGGNVAIPSTINGEAVTSIGVNVFYGCGNLTSVMIPSSVRSIGDFAFQNCPGLTSVTIPECVTNIGKSAFLGCKALTSVAIPEGVTSISESTFASCENLPNVTIPSTVTNIDYQAFFGCEKLTSVTIPSSVRSIGDEAFILCSALTSVTVLAEEPPTGGADMFKYCPDGLLIYVPKASVEDYRKEWSEYKNIIKPIGYDPSRVVEIALPAGEGYGYVVSNLTVNAEIEAGEDGTYALPVGARVGIYAVAEEGYVVVGPNPCVIDTVKPDTTIDPSKLPTAEGRPGTKGNPWLIGSPNAADVTAYVKDGSLVIAGSGAMSNFVDAADAPWATVADKVKAVTVEEGVTLGANALAALSDDVLVTSTSPIRSMRGALGASAGPSLPEGTIAVSKTELEAAGAATLTIVDGTAYVGVVVRTNGDLTAETKSWGRVKFGKDVKVDVSEDGTELVIPVPANARQGFMVLESKTAEK